MFAVFANATCGELMKKDAISSNVPRDEAKTPENGSRRPLMHVGAVDRASQDECF